MQMQFGSGLKSFVRDLAKRNGIHIYRRLPRGVDPLHDFKAVLDRQSFRVVFDVGANVGQSAEEIIRAFPDAHVWCFEPSAKSCAAIRQRYSGDSRVRCEQMALGETAQNVTLHWAAGDKSTMNHIQSKSSDAASHIAVDGGEDVAMDSLDHYCAAHDISHVDFLKIDTEGYDVEVLRGARHMLADNAIDLVQCECAMSPENRFHRSLDEVRDVLEPLGYRLFGFYEQWMETFAKTPNLRRANVVFISKLAMARNALH